MPLASAPAGLPALTMKGLATMTNPARTDEERIKAALDAGWTHIYFASGPSTHPMCAGIRGVHTGPRTGDETLIGTPPGKWYSSDPKHPERGSGPSEELPQ